MFEESKRAFELQVGDIGQDESKALPALDFLTAISLRTMTRIVAGKELARDEKFLKATTNYLNGNFMIGFIMLNLPFGRTVNDLLAWPLYKYHQHFRQQYVINMIKPFVTKRMEEHRLGTHEKREFDTIRATLNLLHEFPFDANARDSPAHTLSHETLQLVWAGGQSPAISAGSIVFKLLEEPAYIDPLREEAQAAIDRHGWADAIFNELPKLDSFIRETHRLHPVFSRTYILLVMVNDAADSPQSMPQESSRASPSPSPTASRYQRVPASPFRPQRANGIQRSSRTLTSLTASAS